MFKKSLNKFFIYSAALIGCGVMVTSPASADSCPAIISGLGLAVTVCDFGILGTVYLIKLLLTVIRL